MAIWTQIATSESSENCNVPTGDQEWGIRGQRCSCIPPLPCTSMWDTTQPCGGCTHKVEDRAGPHLPLMEGYLKGYRSISTSHLHGNMCCESSILVEQPGRTHQQRSEPTWLSYSPLWSEQSLNFLSILYQLMCTWAKLAEH